ncbi:phage baseplate plug family protein [Fictibacillus gelatini]|uniref:phage baseplate plug family protein n=1 Tax=Fictibacillus gelatini TaxID=225985 RepID=UPI0003FE536A|nr:hypothetical protein [Fictibacillus gelatini]
MNKDYIEIDKEELPVRFEIDFAEETFVMEVFYNEIGDFFSVNLFDLNEEPIVLGEKLILNRELWSDITDQRLPAPSLIPLDESGKEDRITFENFGETVFLFIDDVPDGEGEPDGSG